MTLAYDPLGRLYETVGGSTTRFLSDGVDAVAEMNTSGAVLRRYVHGPGMDEPLVWYEGDDASDPRWLLADDLGSIIAVTDDDGAAATINIYDEYGLPGAGNDGRFQYTGQMWVSEVGLYHYKSRAYAPALGRFLQPDPIGYAAGMNLYAYVGADPVNWRDPFGLEEDGDGKREKIVVTGTNSSDSSNGYTTSPGLPAASSDTIGRNSDEPSVGPNREKMVVTGQRRKKPKLAGFMPISSWPPVNDNTQMTCWAAFYECAGHNWYHPVLNKPEWRELKEKCAEARQICESMQETISTLNPDVEFIIKYPDNTLVFMENGRITNIIIGVPRYPGAPTPPTIFEMIYGRPRGPFD